MFVDAIIGGQYGSEGKGVIAASIANDYDIHVRVGGPNAGHTFNHQGRVHVQQAVPCGWINHKAALMIGRGAIVDPALLLEEISQIAIHDPSILRRVFVDEMATIITKEAKDEEGGVEGGMHQRIGSTGEGVGAARKYRMMRDPDLCELARDNKLLRESGVKIVDTVSGLNTRIENGQRVLLEGTQGSGLSLIHGPWPYVTSADTNVAQLLVDTGISPYWLADTIMVVRTFPIRVAGNSGPLKGEVDWAWMADHTGFEGKPERTTVTKKERRIGQWDSELVRRSVRINRPTKIALTFLDYAVPSCTGLDKLDSEGEAFVKVVEEELQTPIRYVGTGGPTWTVVRR